MGKFVDQVTVIDPDFLNNVDDHLVDTANPHSVTKAQLGLGNVDNTADLDKPISTATQAALDLKLADAPSDGTEYLRKNGAWVNPTGGGGVSWSIKSGTYNAVAGDFLAADLSSAGFTINLPASPNVGDHVGFKTDPNASTNNLTVGRNGSNINGSANDLTCDVNNAEFTLVYVSASQGWVV